MEIDPMLMAYARLAQRAALRSHLSDPNATLIDIGLPRRAGQLVEDLTIRFHMREKLGPIELELATARGATCPVPEQIVVGGVRFTTDVLQGDYRPYLWGWPPAPPRNARALRADPLRGGISISDPYHNAYGTLGGLVRDRATGGPMILSNWHVLVADWGARSGQSIYQPGRLDGGGGADTVARLVRHAMGSNLDAAVASLTPGGRVLLNEQLDLGPVIGPGSPQIGMEVVKSGATSEVTYGLVTGVEGVSPPMRYGWLSRMIAHVITIDQRLDGEQVSAPGDSGSWWLDVATMRAVGLHFAGQEVPERALALDMPAVLDALNVDIDTSRATAARPRLGRALAQQSLSAGDAPREAGLVETAVLR
jgi:endonuclease G